MDFVKKQNTQKNSMTDAVKKMDKTSSRIDEDGKSSKNQLQKKPTNGLKDLSAGKGLFHDQNVY